MTLLKFCWIYLYYWEKITSCSIRLEKCERVANPIQVPGTNSLVNNVRKRAVGGGGRGGKDVSKNVEKKQATDLLWLPSGFGLIAPSSFGLLAQQMLVALSVRQNAGGSVGFGG